MPRLRRRTIFALGSGTIAFVKRKRAGFFRKHSLTLIAGGVLALWIVLYRGADPKTHSGAFFGNAIADWSGVLVTVVATKYWSRISMTKSPASRGNGVLRRCRA